MSFFNELFQYFNCDSPVKINMFIVGFCRKIAQIQFQQGVIFLLLESKPDERKIFGFVGQLGQGT